MSEVLSCAGQAVDAARAGGGPQCIVCYTYRLAPHSKGDDNRSPDELRAAWARDPLKAARAAVSDDAAADAIERKAEGRVRSARLRALAAAGAKD